MSQPRIVACIRVGLEPPGFLEREKRERGSTYNVVKCPNCGAQMFLGTRSARLLENFPDAVPLCMQCVEVISKDFPNGADLLNLSDHMPP